MKLLEVDDLKIDVPKENVRLVNGISFSLEQGESLIILGESGSGKTMTCRALMGLLNEKKYKVTGEALLNKENVLTIPMRHRRNLYGTTLAMIPQNPMTAFDPSVKVGKQLLETLRIHKKVSKEQGKKEVYKAMENAGLADVDRIYKSYPFELSGGMLQRLTIAMVLMEDAKVVIADEPTTALDVMHRNEIVSSFISLRDKKISVIIITHDFAVARQFGGNMIVMKDGDIIETGLMQEIMEEPKHEYVKSLIDNASLSKRKEVASL